MQEKSKKLQVKQIGWSDSFCHGDVLTPESILAGIRANRQLITQQSAFQMAPESSRAHTGMMAEEMTEIEFARKTQLGRNVFY